MVEFKPENGYFGVITGKWLPPSAPPKFGGDGSYGFQILPTRPLHDTGKKIDLSVKSKSQTVEF